MLKSDGPKPKMHNTEPSVPMSSALWHIRFGFAFFQTIGSPSEKTTTPSANGRISKPVSIPFSPATTCTKLTVTKIPEP